MKKTVLHLLKSDIFSGAERIVCQIISMFQDDEYRMVYCSLDGVVREHVQKRGIEYYPLKEFSDAEIKKVFSEIHPDIIHAHDFSAGFMAAKHKTAPIVSHLHNNPPWLSEINKKSLAYAAAIPRIDRIFGVSDAVRSDYIFRGIMRNKFEVLPNIVHTPYVTEMAGKKDVAEDIDLLFVGRFAPQKNPLRVLKIVNLLKEMDKKVNVLMLGEGRLRTECQEYITAHGLEDQVQLPGFTENPYPYMKKAKLMIQPSLYEGFGLMIIEAMSLGTPVICSGAGGMKDIVNEKCGVICSTDQEYVNAVIKLLEDDNLRQTMGKEAEHRAYLYGDVDAYKNKLHTCYTELL